MLNMKTLSESHVGDTFFDHKNIGTPLPGFVAAKPMVWAGIFPIDTADFEKLDQSIEKLTLSDSSVAIQKETSNALGQGWRLGFLGTLHMDVFRQRLEQVTLTNKVNLATAIPLSDSCVFFFIRNMMPTLLSQRPLCLTRSSTRTGLQS